MKYIETYPVKYNKLYKFAVNKYKLDCKSNEPSLSVFKYYI